MKTPFSEIELDPDRQIRDEEEVSVSGFAGIASGSVVLRLTTAEGVPVEITADLDLSSPKNGVVLVRRQLYELEVPYGFRPTGPDTYHLILDAECVPAEDGSALYIIRQTGEAGGADDCRKGVRGRE